MSGHSRFTDEVWSTPAPKAPQITVRTVDELRSEIYCTNKYDDYEQALLTAEEMKSIDLYGTYPPNFRNKNKQFIFKYVNDLKQYKPSPNKRLLVTRWRPFLPYKVSDEVSPTSTKVEFRPDVFTYEPCGDENTVEWYLNFANHDLFAYYDGPLLAQDELQVLECVELAALREYFVQTVNTIGSQTKASDRKTHKEVPTPILISNTERVVRMDTKKVYGNAFAKASERQLIQACEFLDHSQIVNLIAIEAPSRGCGEYTRDQVDYIITTAFVGFKAAQIVSMRTQQLNKSERRISAKSRGENVRTMIHTGWWGCGAYGNNRQMMLLTQILAAYWARIDTIVFHLENSDYDADVRAAQKYAQQFLAEKDIDKIIEQICKLQMQWSRSNDT